MTLFERMEAHAALHDELVDPEQIQWAADIREAVDRVRVLREALWILAEHNELHFGKNHNTVMEARAALEQTK